MSSIRKNWINLPKPVKLLDITLVGYGLIFLIAILLYFNVFDHTVQNLMPIFLTAILLLVTWNFRVQLTKSSEIDIQKNNFREWFILCLIAIIIIGILMLVYPVTY